MGHDFHESSPQLWHQVAEGLLDSGTNILNLDRISTDILYFAVVDYQTDAGIIISASHNPTGYNGMKLVGQNSSSRSSNTGLMDIRDAVEDKTLSWEKTPPGNS